MRFFILGMLTFLFAGVFLRNRPQHVRFSFLLGLTAFICVGYFFLQQI